MIMLKRHELRAMLVVAVIIIIVFLIVHFRVQGLELSSFLSVIPYFVVLAVVEVLLLGFRERIEKFFGRKTEEVTKSEVIHSNPVFAHLTVHFPSMRIETFDPSQQKYVTDNRNVHTYYFPSYLEPHIREISPCFHDGESTLRAFVRRNSDMVYDRHPTPEELGLTFAQDGTLIKASDSVALADIKTKLKGRKFEDYRVVYLERFSLRAESHRIGRTLFLKKSVMEAWEPPFCASELIASGLLDKTEFGMRPWESCDQWAKRKGYKFIQWRYPESKLLEGL
jgi:hypothetical protein